MIDNKEIIDDVKKEFLQIVHKSVLDDLCKHFERIKKSIKISFQCPHCKKDILDSPVESDNDVVFDITVECPYCDFQILLDFSFESKSSNSEYGSGFIKNSSCKRCYKRFHSVFYQNSGNTKTYKGWPNK